MQRRAGSGSGVNLCAERKTDVPDFSETDNSEPDVRLKRCRRHDRHDKNETSVSRRAQRKIPVAVLYSCLHSIKCELETHAGTDSEQRARDQIQGAQDIQTKKRLRVQRRAGSRSGVNLCAEREADVPDFSETDNSEPDVHIERFL
jgi:hypothetical protein